MVPQDLEIRNLAHVFFFFLNLKHVKKNRLPVVSIEHNPDFGGIAIFLVGYIY